MHVGIFNSDSELLIQKRQSFKETYPNLWDITAGGHVISGETSEEAIERELFEELGYKYDFSSERPYFTINYEKGYSIFLAASAYQHCHHIYNKIAKCRCSNR